MKGTIATPIFMAPNLQPIKNLTRSTAKQNLILGISFSPYSAWVWYFFQGKLETNFTGFFSLDKCKSTFFGDSGLEKHVTPISQTFDLDDLDDAKTIYSWFTPPKIPQECNLKYRKKWKKNVPYLKGARYCTFAKPLVLGTVSMLNLRGVLNMKPVCDKNLKESSQVQNHHKTFEPILLGLKPGFSFMANKSIRSYFIPLALYQPSN